MEDIRIAAITCQAVVGDIDNNLARTIHWTRRAKAAGAELVCFPELNITGYCPDPIMAALAQPIPGPTTDELGRLAQETNLTLLAGMVECNGLAPPYISHCMFQPDGRLQVYRKLHLSPREQPHFELGRDLPVFQTAKLTFGIQLCYDGHFPELATAMTHAGAEALFLPHASPRGDAQSKHKSWMRHLPARAYDNSVFIVACNQWGNNAHGLTFPGNAVVLDPSGAILQKNLRQGEGMLVADLTRKTLTQVRRHPMRHFFPNRRPELYR